MTSEPSPDPRASSVPRWLDLGAAIGWRVIAVGVALYLTWIAIQHLNMVILPLFFGTILAALLEPPTRWLQRLRLPRGLAAAVTVLLFLGIFGGLIALIVWTASREIDEVGQGLKRNVEELLRFLRDSPLGIGPAEIDAYVEQAIDQAGAVMRQVAIGAITVITVLSGGVLSVVFALFFLISGKELFDWLVCTFPRDEQRSIRLVGQRTWTTLGGYMRGIAITSTFNALATGLALFIIGVPLIAPLMLLTLIGSFIPFLGPIFAGIAAAIIALASGGMVDALLVALAITIIQQFESNVLQPFVLGKTVRMSPVLVLLAVTTGLVLGGLAGAFLSVPLAAVIVSFLDARAKEHGATADSG